MSAPTQPPSHNITDGRLVIFLPVASPSANTFAYRHWRVRHKSKADWAALMALAMPRMPQVASKALGRRRLTIERHGRRALDLDNLIGGAKGIIDNLRAMGLILDDNPNALELVAINAPLTKGQAPHTLLLLEDIA